MVYGIIAVYLIIGLLFSIVLGYQLMPAKHFRSDIDGVKILLYLLLVIFIWPAILYWGFRQ